MGRFFFCRDVVVNRSMMKDIIPAAGPIEKKKMVFGQVGPSRWDQSSGGPLQSHSGGFLFFSGASDLGDAIVLITAVNFDGR